MFKTLYTIYKYYPLFITSYHSIQYLLWLYYFILRLSEMFTPLSVYTTPTKVSHNTIKEHFHKNHTDEWIVL